MKEKKSVSSTSSAESEDSGSASKGRIKKVGNIYPSKGEQGLIISETGIAPAITSRKKGGGKVGPLVAVKDSKKRIIEVGNLYPSGGESGKIYDPKGLAPALTQRGERPALSNFPKIIVSDASGPAITTGSPTRSTSGGSSRREENIIQATLDGSPLRTSLITTFSVLDSLAKHSRLPEKGKGLETLVGRFSTRSPALRGLKDPRYYSWKTSKDSSATTKGRPSELSWKSWGVLAIDSNGRCSTLSGSASPRTGSVCSLSDILETEVDDRYFLSKRLVDSLLEHKRRHEEAGHGFGMNVIAFQEASESEEAESRKT